MKIQNKLKMKNQINAKMKNTIIIGILIMLVLAVQVNAAEITIKIDDMSVEQGSKSMIPVSVAGASKLGAADIKIEYDSTVIKFVDVELGEISTNGIIESNEVDSGIVLLSFADTKGISSDGTLIELNFEGTGAVGSSTKIEIEGRAYGIDLKDMPVKTDGGIVTVSEKSGGICQILPDNIRQMLPESICQNLLYIIIGVFVLIILLIFMIFRRKK